jgi:hypothetical protein
MVPKCHHKPLHCIPPRRGQRQGRSTKIWKMRFGRPKNVSISPWLREELQDSRSLKNKDGMFHQQQHLSSSLSISPETSKEAARCADVFARPCVEGQWKRCLGLKSCCVNPTRLVNQALLNEDPSYTASALPAKRQFQADRPNNHGKSPTATSVGECT